jgi:hypothetical protein
MLDASKLANIKEGIEAVCKLQQKSYQNSVEY